MKNLLLAVVCLAAAASPVWAQKHGDAGIGVILGNPTGVTGKIWLDGSQAVDLGLGFSSRFTAYGDYLWHSWKVLPQPVKGRLPVYIGVGGQVRTFRDAEFGIRTVAGLAYWLEQTPVELFLEIAPVFRVSPESSVGLDGGVGLRYYFKT